MMDLEPQVLEVISYEAISTFDVVKRLYTTEWEIKSKRGAIFKALCNLEKRGCIESRVIRQDRTVNPSRFWVLPGGTFPKGVDE